MLFIPKFKYKDKAIFHSPISQNKWTFNLFISKEVLYLLSDYDRQERNLK
jgi:hypothetical protein